MKLLQANSANVIDWGVSTDDGNYIKRDASLVELGKLPLKGMYTHDKSKFGEQGVYIVQLADGTIGMIDAPGEQLETIKECLADEEEIANIKAGKYMIEAYQYESKKYGKNCYGIKIYAAEESKPEGTNDFKFKI